MGSNADQLVGGVANPNDPRHVLDRSQRGPAVEGAADAELLRRAPGCSIQNAGGNLGMAQIGLGVYVHVAWVAAVKALPDRYPIAVGRKDQLAVEVSQIVIGD